MNPPYFAKVKVEQRVAWEDNWCPSIYHPDSASIRYNEIPSDEQIKSDVVRCGCPVTIIRKSWIKETRSSD